MSRFDSVETLVLLGSRLLPSLVSTNTTPLATLLLELKVTLGLYALALPHPPGGVRSGHVPGPRGPTHEAGASVTGQALPPLSVAPLVPYGASAVAWGPKYVRVLLARIFS